MTWRVPRRKPADGQVIDDRDFNEYFQEFVEADGELGEGNFNDAMATQLDMVSNLDADIAYRKSQIPEGGKSVYCGGGSSVAGTVELSPGPGWQVVQDGSDDLIQEIDVTTGPLLMYASFQLGRKIPADKTGNINDQTYMHVLPAFRVDGNIIETSVQGDQDWASSGEFMEKGYLSILHGVEMLHVLPVAPGKHTVEVVLLVYGEGSGIKTTDDFAVVYSRELNVVEVK